MSESETTCHDCGGTQDDVDGGIGPLSPCDLCDERRMVCPDCGYQLDERGEPDGSGGIVACGECYSRLNHETTPDEVVVLRAENTRLRSILAALVTALPKCDYCESPATRARVRGGRIEVAEKERDAFKARVAELESGDAILRLELRAERMRAAGFARDLLEADARNATETALEERNSARNACAVVADERNGLRERVAELENALAAEKKHATDLLEYTHALASQNASQIGTLVAERDALKVRGVELEVDGKVAVTAKVHALEDCFALEIRVRELEDTKYRLTVERDAFKIRAAELEDHIAAEKRGAVTMGQQLDRIVQERDRLVTELVDVRAAGDSIRRDLAGERYERVRHHAAYVESDRAWRSRFSARLEALAGGFERVADGTRDSDKERLQWRPGGFERVVDVGSREHPALPSDDRAEIERPTANLASAEDAIMREPIIVPPRYIKKAIALLTHLVPVWTAEDADMDAAKARGPVAT